MTDLYLICHKVRGLPAFDVAQQMLCPHCIEPDASNSGCHECDGLGYWWIIPTSGHRAYPVSCIPLNELDHLGHNMMAIPLPTIDMVPDHYSTTSTPKVSLAEALGIRPAPSAPIVRRF